MAKKNSQFDVVVIGAGIIGSAISYELSKFEINTLQLERNSYIADETSRGNSGVIHGGFDAEPGKVEADLNLAGNRLWTETIFKDLDFPRAKIDSLVIAFNEEECEHLEMLYNRGITNKLDPKNLKIISKTELRKREPLISNKAVAALLCTSSWAIDPVKATQAFAGGALNNGHSLKTNSEVVEIQKKADVYEIKTANNEKFSAKIVINAAGHYADVIAKLANHSDFQQTTRRGEYRILSKVENKKVQNICFKVPTIHGKGVVVAPMLDGRVMVGPTALEGVPKEDTRLVTTEMWNKIGKIGHEIIPSLDIDKTEMTLAGSRPIDVKTNDFVIRHSQTDKNFVHVAGMQSPGLSSAPAIALKVADLVRDSGLKLTLKPNFNPKFKVIW